MGKIEEVFKGKDENVRIVSIKLEGVVKKKEKLKIEPTSSPILKAKMFLVITMIMLFCQAAQATTKAKEKYSMKELSNSSSIYLDAIGEVEVVRSSWNLVIYYNMDAYFGSINKANKLIPKMRAICKKLQIFEDHCNLVLDEIQRKISDLEENNQWLLASGRRREKRAIIPLVGPLYNILFGLMDEDDRKANEDNLKTLFRNQHKLQELQDNHTSMIDSTVNILKRTSNEVQSNFQLMNNRIENMTKLLERNHQVVMYSVSFFMVTQQLNSIVSECEKIQESIISLLIDINQDRINPNLLRPDQIRNEITKIKGLLTESLVLPGKRTNTELKEIYSLLVATATFNLGKLIISAKIPLFGRHPSKLYKVIPIPINRNNQTIIVQVDKPYLVYNFEIDSYHLMTEASLNNCRKWKTDRRVCDGNWPWSTTNDKACEVSPLRPNEASNCRYKTKLQTNNYIVELNNKSSWLFKINDNKKARLQCEDSQQEIVHLPEQGVLTLRPDCTLRTNDKWVIAHHNLYSESNVNIVTPHIGELNNISKIILDPLKLAAISHKEEILKLQTQIQEIKENHFELGKLKLNVHHVSGHISLVLTLILIVTLMIIYLIRKIQIRKRLLAITFSGPAQNVQA